MWLRGLRAGCYGARKPNMWNHTHSFVRIHHPPINFTSIYGDS